MAQVGIVIGRDRRRCVLITPLRRREVITLEESARTRYLKDQKVLYDRVRKERGTLVAGTYMPRD